MALVPTTWNPADKSTDISLSGGDLIATCTLNGWASVRSILGVSSGKWYWEITVNAITSSYGEVAIGDSGVGLDAEPGVNVDGYAYRGLDGNKMNNNSWEAYGATFTDGDIISVALDMDGGKLWWAKNGVWQASGDPGAGTNEAYSGIVGTLYAMVCIYHSSKYMTANFGDSAFAYSVPSGFTSGFGSPGASTSLTDLSIEIKASEEIITDLLSEIIAGVESLTDLNSSIDVLGQSFTDLKSDIAATFTTDFKDLLAEIITKAEIFYDLETEISAGNISLTDLLSEIITKAQKIYDLKSEIAALTPTIIDLKTSIEAVRSKWWLKSEIKAGCAARYSFDTEWNPNRFLMTEIAAKKPHEFSFNTISGSNYAATSPQIEILTATGTYPLRTLFLDYITPGSENEYVFKLWFARGLGGGAALKNAKIKAEYINTSDAGGFEIVELGIISVKVGDGEYQTVSTTPLLLGDILADSYLDLSLKITIRDCTLSRGLIFFKLILTGDLKESLYSDKVVYGDGSQYFLAEVDDYTSNDFVCRLYIVG